MEANPPELKRDGTMQVTAKEGIEFLKRSGAEDLIPVVDGEGDAKPEIKRDTTMEATLKEGEAFLEAAGKPAEEARTRGDQEELDAAEGDAPPAIPRDNTMQVTAKEGKEILGDEELGSTRAETEALKDAEADGEVDEDDDEVDEEDDEGDDDDEEENGDEENGEEEDRANLKRTIAEPVTEGEECLKRQKTNGEATEESAPAEAEAAS